MAKKSTPKKISQSALATLLDGDPKIRAALIARMVKAAEKAPVVLLHQVCIALDAAAESQP
jgi:hypothetical protein